MKNENVACVVIRDCVDFCIYVLVYLIDVSRVGFVKKFTSLFPAVWLCAWTCA